MHSKRRVQGKLDLEYYTCNLMFEVLLQVVLKSNFHADKSFRKDVLP